MTIFYLGLILAGIGAGIAWIVRHLDRRFEVVLPPVDIPRPVQSSSVTERRRVVDVRRLSSVDAADQMFEPDTPLHPRQARGDLIDAAGLTPDDRVWADSGDVA